MALILQVFFPKMKASSHFQMPLNQERREEPRRKVKILVVFAAKKELCAAPEWTEGIIQDASPKGVRIKAPVVFEPNEVLELYCAFPQSRDIVWPNCTFYRMEGKVVWKNESTGQMGVMFI